jgi:hypothetical protein
MPRRDRVPPLNGNRPHERPLDPRRPAPAKVASAATYELAWDAYRQRGRVRDVLEALAPLGVSAELCRSMVHVGLPTIGLRPLSVRLEETTRAALRTEAVTRDEVERLSVEEAGSLVQQRAQQVEEARARTTAILGDARTQHEAEAALARDSRVLVQTSMSALAGTMMGLPKLVERTRKAMESQELTLAEGLDAIRIIATSVHKLAEATRTSIQAEHLVLGKPTSIQGNAVDDGPEMTPEEAEQYVAIIERAARRNARKRTVVDAA